MTTRIDTTNLHADLKAVSAERVRLGSEASVFYKTPREITKEAYLAWKAQRKAAYREITRLIRILKRIARTHGFSEGGYNQSRAQHELLWAKGCAQDLMECLRTAKEANAERYRLANEAESSSGASQPSGEAA